MHPESQFKRFDHAFQLLVRLKLPQELLVGVFGERKPTQLLVPVHIRRVAGSRHHMEFGPEIDVPQTRDRTADVAETTARINAAIESFIRAHPEHWLWSHRRFRHSPDVEGDPYAGL